MEQASIYCPLGPVSAGVFKELNKNYQKIIDYANWKKEGVEMIISEMNSFKHQKYEIFYTEKPTALF